MSFGLMVAYTGLALAVIANFWVALIAFRKSVLWGLAVLCIPIVALIFVILNFQETKSALILYVLGVLLSGAGTGMASRSERMRLLREQAAAQQ
jgi:hypothetical protein